MKAIACSLMMVLPLLADGIPVDRETGRITTEHVVVTLDENQQEEIVVLGSLTLRPDQWSRIRKDWPAVPKRIASVLPKDWSDCTCCVEGPDYAIQMEGDRVALLKFMYDQPAGAGLVEACESGASVGFTVDHRGQFYFDRKLIRYTELLAALERMKPKDGDGDFSLAIDLPVDLARDASALRARISEVEAKAVAAGWSVWVY